MADNVAITAGSGTAISTEEFTTLNGGAVSAQHGQRVIPAFRTANSTAVDFPGDGTDGLLVNLGANNDVTVTGDALTALQLIDDVIYVDDADFTDGTSKSLLIGAVAESSSPTTVTEGDEGAVAMTLNRALKTSEYSPANVSIYGSAGSAAAPVVTVQGIASMTPVDVAVVSGGLTPARAAAAALSNVSGATSSTTLQASNTDRLRLDIYNDSESALYVKFGSSASTTSFTKKLEPFQSMSEDLYTGIVTGIWDSAVGAARMSELTAS